MALTLLEMVQDILSDMESDEVNSINDTTESLQVAQIVKTTYRAMLSNRNWAHQRRIVNLTPSSDITRPTHMVLQQNVKEVISLYYNTVRINETQLRYERVHWREPDEFLRVTNARNNDNDNVDIIIDPSGVQLLIINNKAPEYFTSFDDKGIVFDSYDSAVDTTLQSSKTQMMAYINLPDLELVDDAIPDLPEEAFIA